MVKVHPGVPSSQAQQTSCPPALVPGLQASRDAIYAPARSLCVPQPRRAGRMRLTDAQPTPGGAIAGWLMVQGLSELRL